ncbi:hypothetical protein RSOLAG1IB_06447 [Rhizoctonia solani AG-1 IB]|uniref:Uncharacterized protein n=1 Tax=Thanatephorus cucumeris (strain AG1-IB / isolate 7/3/14) TaxID=1108050 RepID=A0A0B7FBM2_THACB|nr:hypothetical protein RSOLAG1IB_06447 [Rhizoctonia solani AG-1 IB]
MMLFHSAFAVVTVLASFALSSYANPIHHGRTGLTATTTISNPTPEGLISGLKKLQENVDTCSGDISKAASMNTDPEDEMSSLNSFFLKLQLPIATSIKLTPEQEKECSTVVAAVLAKAIKACHEVAANHNFMKYYAKWTETDIAMHSFMQKIAGVSFAVYKQSLLRAGKSSATYLHDMKMRHMVNDFRGMGVSHE